MSDIFETVKNHCNIIDIAERYCRSGPIKKSGKLFRCKSPFNNEKTASCFLYPETNSFMDYSSGRGGDCIRYVALLFGISDYEAALKIAEDFHITIEGNKKLKKNEVRQIIQENEELDRTAEYLKNLSEILYDKLCTLFKVFRELRNKADKEKIKKSSLIYQEILFNLDFFDRYSEFFANANAEKQIDYTLHIADYYMTEWRCFTEWLASLTSNKPLKTNNYSKVLRIA